MKLTDISNNKAKEIIEGAPKEATHFSCIEGKTQYYKNETVISSLDEVFINVFRDIFQPSVFLLSDLENQMNIDKVETQTEHQEEMSAFSGEVEWKNGDIAYDCDGNEITIINPNMIYGLDSTGTYHYWDREDLSKNKPETQEEKEKREWIERWASEVKLIGTMTYKDILSRMYDSLAIVDKTNYRKGVK
jgi:hypothetical protein